MILDEDKKKKFTKEREKIWRKLTHDEEYNPINMAVVIILHYYHFFKR